MTIAKFCPECGHQTGGAKFCPECGTATAMGAAPAEAASLPTRVETEFEEERELWQGSPDPVLDALAARSTKYVLTTDRLRVQSGLIGKRSEQLELYRIRDVSVRRSLPQRARGCGDVIVASKDDSTPKLLLAGVKDPDGVAETIRAAARKSRERAGVRTQEYL